MIDIKIFTYGVGQGGGQEALSVQKNEKTTRTPILKSNFQEFLFRCFFQRWIFKISLTGVGGPGWNWEGDFFNFVFISSM